MRRERGWAWLRQKVGINVFKTQLSLNCSHLLNSSFNVRMCGGLLFIEHLKCCKLFSLFVSGLQRGCAILAGRGFTLLARLNSTSMNIQIGAERPGRGRGASGASLSLTTGQGLSGPQFEVRPMKFVEYSAFAS